jgi:hypothetical protein
VVNHIEIAEGGDTVQALSLGRLTSCDLDGTCSATNGGGDGEPLEWATYPPLPVRVQSLPGGAGAGPLHGRAVSASGLSSLDPITNNRHNENRAGLLWLSDGQAVRLDTGEIPYIPPHYRRPVGRGKYCGRMSVSGVDPKTGRKVFRRINCNGWTCSYCGPRKARNARLRIRNEADRLGLRFFLTLTLDPKKLKNPKFSVAYLRLVFNKFREYLRREFGEAPTYICILEFTKAGVPHLHVLFDRRIPQAWISSVWDSLGGGRIVFIKQVSIQRVARYLSKYLTKDLILSAPKGARRITTSRSIKLFPKFDSGVAWELLKMSIWTALSSRGTRSAREEVSGDVLLVGVEHQSELFSAEYVRLLYDEEAFLNGFEIHNSQTIGEVKQCVQ